MRGKHQPGLQVLRCITILSLALSYVGAYSPTGANLIPLSRCGASQRKNIVDACYVRFRIATNATRHKGMDDVRWLDFVGRYTHAVASRVRRTDSNTVIVLAGAPDAQPDPGANTLEVGVPDTGAVVPTVAPVSVPPEAPVPSAPTPSGGGGAALTPSAGGGTALTPTHCDNCGPADAFKGLNLLDLLPGGLDTGVDPSLGASAQELQEAGTEGAGEPIRVLRTRRRIVRHVCWMLSTLKDMCAELTDNQKATIQNLATLVVNSTAQLADGLQHITSATDMDGVREGAIRALPGIGTSSSAYTLPPLFLQCAERHRPHVGLIAILKTAVARGMSQCWASAVPQWCVT